MVPGAWWVADAVKHLKGSSEVPPLRAHFSVDTGMGRDGVMPETALAVAAVDPSCDLVTTKMYPYKPVLKEIISIKDSAQR